MPPSAVKSRRPAGTVLLIQTRVSVTCCLPGGGELDGARVHCSLLDVSHFSLILSLLRAVFVLLCFLVFFVLRQSLGQQQVLPFAEQ